MFKVNLFIEALTYVIEVIHCTHLDVPPPLSFSLVTSSPPLSGAEWAFYPRPPPPPLRPCSPVIGNLELAPSPWRQQDSEPSARDAKLMYFPPPYSALGYSILEMYIHKCIERQRLISYGDTVSEECNLPFRSFHCV